MRACWTRCCEEIQIDVATRATARPFEPGPRLCHSTRNSHRFACRRFVYHQRADGSPAPQVIDHFFESLATDRGASARGVVLSGIGSDGTQGLSSFASARNRLRRIKNSCSSTACQKRDRVGRCRCCIAAGAIAAELATAHPSRATAAPREIRFRPQRSDIDEILAAAVPLEWVDFSQYK